MADIKSINVREAVMAELAQRKSAAMRLKSEREEYIEKNVEGYAEISKEIRKCGIALGRMALRGKDTDAYKEMQQKLDELIAEKQSLIKDRREFMENVYKCNICHDTGFCDENGVSVTCRCYKSILSEKLMENYGISAENGTFEMFNLDFYSEETDEALYGAGATPRKVMTKVLEYCKKYVESFDDENTSNLLLSGKTGVGKTFMCNCLAYALSCKGIPVLYMSAPALLSKATMLTANDEQRVNQQEFCALIRSVDVLIIDDLGTEKQSDTKYQELLEILNERIRGYGKGLRTIISTNLSPKDIYAYYDERIGSRLLGEFKCIRFIGENIRMIKK